MFTLFVTTASHPPLELGSHVAEFLCCKWTNSPYQGLCVEFCLCCVPGNGDDVLTHYSWKKECH